MFCIIQPFSDHPILAVVCIASIWNIRIFYVTCIIYLQRVRIVTVRARILSWYRRILFIGLFWKWLEPFDLNCIIWYFCRLITRVVLVLFEIVMTLWNIDASNNPKCSSCSKFPQKKFVYFIFVDQKSIGHWTPKVREKKNI